MRYVVKGNAPHSLIQWKAQGNPDWQPSYGNLQNPQKRELHNALLFEQGSVCCYCGRRITYESSHIEHFRPREAYPHLELDYLNLHASCMRETDGSQPLHCGHAKGSDFSEPLHISPLYEQCERGFTHTLDGRELPADAADEAAGYMIDILNQNAAFLRRRRGQALVGIFDVGFLVSATVHELQAIIQVYRSTEEENSFRDFAHVIAGYAERLLALTQAQ